MTQEPSKAEMIRRIDNTCLTQNREQIAYIVGCSREYVRQVLGNIKDNPAVCSSCKKALKVEGRGNTYSYTTGLCKDCRQLRKIEEPMEMFTCETCKVLFGHPLSYVLRQERRGTKIRFCSLSCRYTRK